MLTRDRVTAAGYLYAGMFGWFLNVERAFLLVPVLIALGLVALLVQQRSAAVLVASVGDQP